MAERRKQRKLRGGRRREKREGKEGLQGGGQEQGNIPTGSQHALRKVCSREGLGEPRLGCGQSPGGQRGTARPLAMEQAVESLLDFFFLFSGLIALWRPEETSQLRTSKATYVMIWGLVGLLGIGFREK